MFFQRLGHILPVLFSIALMPLAVADSGPLNPAVSNTLKPFATDGCSNWFDGTYSDRDAWRHCCVVHDKAYWIGGTSAERVQADEILKACVTQTGHSFNANYMYFWIRLGGQPGWPTPYRWGYGWNYFEPSESAWMPKAIRGYRALTDEEKLQVAKLMPQANQLVADDLKAHPTKHNLAQHPKANQPSPSVVAPIR